MEIKMPVAFCAFRYEKDGVKHYSVFVQDGQETREFPTTVYVPAGKSGIFKLNTLVDMRQTNDGKYRPGSHHGKTILEFSRIASGTE